MTIFSILAITGTIIGIIAGCLTIRDKLVRLKFLTQTGVTTTSSHGIEVKEIDREITITVTNDGGRTVSINNLYCKNGIGQQDHILFMPLFVEEISGKTLTLPKIGVKDYGDKMPKKIGDGDNAIYRLPRDFIISCYETFIKRHPFIPKKIILKYFFKYGIITTTGKRYESTFNKTIQKRLMGKL